MRWSNHTKLATVPPPCVVGTASPCSNPSHLTTQSRADLQMRCWSGRSGYTQLLRRLRVAIYEECSQVRWSNH